MTVRKKKKKTREKKKSTNRKKRQSSNDNVLVKQENAILAKNQIKSCVQHAVCDTGLRLQGEDDVENGW
jgi:hypothetical protein